MADMCCLVRVTMEDQWLPMLLTNVFVHTGIMVDLWPEHESDLTLKERKRKAIYHHKLIPQLMTQLKQFSDEFAAKNPLLSLSETQVA